MIKGLFVSALLGGVAGGLRMAAGKVARKLDLHHAFPKFLGGFDNIDNLVRLPCGQHTELHKMIMAELAKRRISRPAKMTWKEFFEKNPAKQRDAIEALIDATEAFDKKNKTNVLDDLFETIIGGDWKDFSVR